MSEWKRLEERSGARITLNNSVSYFVKYVANAELASSLPDDRYINKVEVVQHAQETKVSQSNLSSDKP